MKTIIYALLLFQILSYEIWAGSISGETSYSGSATGTVFIAVFNDPTLHSDPLFVMDLTQPGSYTLSDVSDGTYYIVSVISNNPDQILPTDPYGFWGTLENLTPVVILGNNNVTGIDITLIDGTVENPNPFAQYYVEPNVTIQLPTETESGINPSLVYTGTSIWLYKHDYPGAPSAKIFVINPETGALSNTYLISLESSPNRISWIDKMVFRSSVLWGYGGYGDPSGSGGIEGVFKIDISSCNSSNQIPLSSDFDLTNGLACDGSNLFIGKTDTAGVSGIVKFNPDAVTVVPSELFISLEDRARFLSYGDNFLWVGNNRISKFSPISGEFLGDVNLPGSAAELYFDSKFWTYDESDNTLKVYYLSSVGLDEKTDLGLPEDLSLSQNYPNPFNPSTKIKYTIPNIIDSDLNQTHFVSLKVFDVLGNEVATLVNEEKSAGTYEIEFSTKGGSTSDRNVYNLSSGIYFYKLQVGSFIETKKMTLMK